MSNKKQNIYTNSTETKSISCPPVNISDLRWKTMRSHDPHDSINPLADLSVTYLSTSRITALGWKSVSPSRARM